MHADRQPNDKQNKNRLDQITGENRGNLQLIAETLVEEASKDIRKSQPDLRTAAGVKAKAFIQTLTNAELASAMRQFGTGPDPSSYGVQAFVWEGFRALLERKDGIIREAFRVLPTNVLKQLFRADQMDWIQQSVEFLGTDALSGPFIYLNVLLSKGVSTVSIGCMSRGKLRKEYDKRDFGTLGARQLLINLIEKTESEKTQKKN